MLYCEGSANRKIWSGHSPRPESDRGLSEEGRHLMSTRRPLWFLRINPTPLASIWIIATIAAGNLFWAARSSLANQPMNVLVIHADEFNFRTLGCYRDLLTPDQAYVWGDGVAVETPNLDWIADNGAICERFYAVSPVCTPSRASFVSGRYPQNTGAIRNDQPLRDDVVTFAEVLRRNGYATGYAGKWHLDGPAKPGWAPARKFGFEDNRYMFNRGHWKVLEDTPDGPRVKAKNARGEPTYAIDGADAESFTTDFLATKTIEFLRSHRDQPFCYMVSFPDPHGPNTVRAPYDTMFQNLDFQSPKTARAKGESLPSWARNQNSKFNPTEMARYFGMVKCIDDNMGRILAALRETGLINRTLIVFSADHGDMCGEHGRHNKGVPFEASAKVPFLLFAPGLVKPGTVIRPVLTTVDFKPTLLGLLQMPSDGNDEGRDCSVLFRTGREPPDWKDIGFLRFLDKGSGWLGVFTSRYKLVFSPVTDPCLFDLHSDPDELRNVFSIPAYRDTVRDLAKELDQYCRKMNEPHYSDPAVRADLEWAIQGQDEYRPPIRKGGTL